MLFLRQSPGAQIEKQHHAIQQNHWRHIGLLRLDSIAPPVAISDSFHPVHSGKFPFVFSLLLFSFFILLVLEPCVVARVMDRHSHSAIILYRPCLRTFSIF